MDVEADFQAFARVGDFQLFAGFFLLAVAACDFQAARGQLQANAAEFFVGENGGAFQRAQQRGAVDDEDFVVVQRDDAVVVGEFAVDDFAHDGGVAALEAHLVVQQLNLDGFFGLVEQFHQFQHGFARQNHILFCQLGFNGGAGVGKAMPIGGDKAQLVAFHLQQQAIEIIANILHRHAVLHLANHVFQRFLWQGKLGVGGFADIHGGKIGRRQGLQVKARFACFERELVFV